MAFRLGNSFTHTFGGIRTRPMRSPLSLTLQQKPGGAQARIARYAQWNQGPTRQARKPPRQSILIRWVNSRWFIGSLAGLGAAGSTYYIMHLEEVPISGRRRFNIVTPEMERELAETQYQAFLKEVGPGILPPWHPEVLRVKRVMAKLISGLSNLEDQGMSQKGQGAALTSGKAPWTSEQGLEAWQVHVVDAPILNAVVLPG
jgi:hypothetical protein